MCVSTYVDRGGLWPYCAAPLPPATAAAGCFLKVRIGNLCGDSRLKAFGYLNRVTKMSSSKVGAILDPLIRSMILEIFK